MHHTMIPAYDPDGFFLAAVAPAIAERYVHQGTAARFNRGIQLRRSKAVGIRDLTPQERRALVLAKERAKR